MIPSNFVDIVLDRVSIVDVLSQDINLTKKSGSNYVALCPFHDDSNPSLTVSDEKQIFKCFACGKGGNAISFVMEFHRLGFQEALIDLANRYNIPMPAGGQTEFEKSAKEDIYKVNAMGLDWFSQQYNHAEAAKSYMVNRGFTEPTIAAYSIGYAPSYSNNLFKELTDKGIETSALLKSGLFKDRHGVHDSDKLYTPFFDRLMFPIEDERGRVLGFGGRMMSKDQEGAKYLNTAETEVFHKRKILFGMKQAFESIKKKKVVYIAEGYTDVMMMHQHGYTNTVAVMGTALTSDHVKKIKRFANEAVLILDGDAAGQNAMMRSIDAFISEEFPVYIATLPEGKDPCDMLGSKNEMAFQKCIDSKINMVAFLCKHLGSKMDLDSVEGKVKAGNEIIEVLKSAHNPIQLSALITELSQKLQLDEAGLREHFSQLKNKGMARQRFKAAEEKDSINFKPENVGLNVERLLLSLAIKSESHYYDLVALEAQNYLLEPMVCEMFDKFTKAETWDQLGTYVSKNGNEEEKAFFNYLAYVTIELKGINLEKEFNRLMQEHKKHLKNKLQAEIQMAEKEKDTNRVNALWLEFANLK